MACQLWKCQSQAFHIYIYRRKKFMVLNPLWEMGLKFFKGQRAQHPYFSSKFIFVRAWEIPAVLKISLWTQLMCKCWPCVCCLWTDYVIHVKRFALYSAIWGNPSDQINRSLLCSKSSKQDTLCILKANIIACRYLLITYRQGHLISEALVAL